MSEARGGPNPYTYTLPVWGPGSFYGRTNHVREILEHIERGECVNVVGDRRSGKTSLLRHLAHPATRQRYHFHGDQTLFLFVAPELIAPRTPEGFYRELLIQMRAQCEGAGISVPPMSADPSDVRALFSVLQPCRLALLIDEFEIITRSESFPIDFYEFLRGCSTSYAISFVVATSRPLKESCPEHMRSSPFVNIFVHPLSLGAFRPEEFDTFIAETAKSSGAPMGQVQNEIEHMAGHLPYLVQMACYLYYHAWSWSEELGPALYSHIRPLFDRHAETYLDSVWHHFGEAERALVRHIAQGNPVPDHYLELARHLQERGHLHDGRILSDALAQYALHQPPTDEGVDTLSVASPPSPAPPMQGIWVDEGRGDVYIDGELRPQLTRLTWRLVKLLWAHGGAICSHDEILKGVWGEQAVNIGEADESKIYALARRVRKAIEPQPSEPRYVITVSGRGLKLENLALHGPGGSSAQEPH